MLFHDRAKIQGNARITRDGYFVADALVAQADNVQAYTAAEIGQPAKADGSPYLIGRMADEVFADAAMASAAHRPITIGHPTEDVTAANWKRFAVGDIGDEISQQGKFLRVPVKMMDAAAIQAARTTHQEFSLGYSADLDMTPTRIGDQQVDGVMRGIKINHLALVPAARGGPQLRIIDERPDHLQETVPMKIKIGDAEVDATNGEAVSIAVRALDAKLTASDTALGTVTAQLADAKTALETKDGEIAALKTQVADAAVTPAKLADMVAARAKIIDAAKALGVEGIADQSDAEIKKLAVSKKMGDKFDTSMSDAAIDGAFAAFSLAPSGTGLAPRGTPVSLGDARDAEAAALAQANDFNSWRNASAA
jgi:hypothetical protein